MFVNCVDIKILLSSGGVDIVIYVFVIVRLVIVMLII